MKELLSRVTRSLGGSDDSEDSAEQPSDRDGTDLLQECPECGEVYLSDHQRECSNCGRTTVSAVSGSAED